MSGLVATFLRARPKRVAVVPFGGFVVICTSIGFGTTHAAFNGAATNTANSVSAAPDLAAPTVVRTVVAKRNGNPGTTDAYLSAGHVDRSQGYNVFAQVVDTGNPPVGGNPVVTATVSGITPTQTTAVTLVRLATPQTVDGQTYNYRSANLVTGATISPVQTYNVTTTDAVPNAATTTHPVNVDIVDPTAQDVTTVNGGATPGRPERLDQIILTYSEPIESTTVSPGWNGTTPLTVTVDFTNVGTTDTLTISGTNGIQTRGNYVTANTSFGTAGTPSTAVMSASASNQITVTLGAQNGGTVATQAIAALPAMTWTPTAGPIDRAANPLAATTANESGALDRDF